MFSVFANAMLIVIMAASVNTIFFIFLPFFFPGLVLEVVPWICIRVFNMLSLKSLIFLISMQSYENN